MWVLGLRLCTLVLRGGAGGGDSVSSVIITFFSIHDLEPAPRPHPSMPTLRSRRVPNRGDYTTVRGPFTFSHRVIRFTQRRSCHGDSRLRLRVGLSADEFGAALCAHRDFHSSRVGQYFGQRLEVPLERPWCLVRALKQRCSDLCLPRRE